MSDMDCEQMRQAILGGGDLASAEAERHLAACPACADLAADGGALARLLAGVEPGREAIAEPSFQDLERSLAGEKGFFGRFASLPSATRWLLAGAVLFVPVATGLAKLRPDIAVYPPARLAIELCALAGFGLASIWLWLRPLYRRQLGYGLLFAFLAAGLLLPWLLAALPPARANTLWLQTVVPGGLHPHAAGCFAFGSALALPVVVVIAGLGRRGRSVPGFMILPAVAGALTGLVGLELHCPDASPSHLLAGHAPIAVVLPLLFYLGARFFRARKGSGGHAHGR